MGERRGGEDRLPERKAAVVRPRDWAMRIEGGEVGLEGGIFLLGGEVELIF